MERISLRTKLLALIAGSFIAGSGQGQTVIVTQPQATEAVVGGSATLSVSALGHEPVGAFPSVTSGAMLVWLKADAGVVTNSSGQVSVWHDQSGHGFDVGQSNAGQQPMLTVNTLSSAPVAALRFDGNPGGEYLYTTADLGLSGGYTSFFVYSVPVIDAYAKCIMMVGRYNDYNSVRSSYLQGANLGFSAWGNDYLSSLGITANTRRIWTDRVSGTLGENDIFDTDGTTDSEVSQATGGLLTPAGGFYVCGLNDSIRNLACDLSEMIFYSGALSETDRLAVVNYLKQKYYQPSTTNGLFYQWQFNGTNIAGATNATLTITNAQLADGGFYSVAVSNQYGGAASSLAALSVGYAPTISGQPEGVEVVQGTAVSFSVNAGGSSPLSYQWYHNGAMVSGATSSNLDLTSAQPTLAGAYSVLVSNIFGTAASSNAVLTVDQLPGIVSQPRSQVAAVGSTVTLAVSASGSDLPVVSSGSVALWLKADSGVAADGGGNVSVWRDQSSNAFDAFQGTLSQQPVLTTDSFPNGSRAVVRFNGLPYGDFMYGPSNLNLTGGLTTFYVYYNPVINDYAKAIMMIGQYNAYDSVRSCYIQGSNLGFSAWANDYLSSITISSNSYRIWTDRLSDNLRTNEIFDTDGLTSSHVTQPVSGLFPPGPGYYVGGFGDETRSVAFDLAEMIFYKGALTEADRLAVASYLQEKYYTGGTGGATNGLAFQWEFDGTNIAGATNTTLTLTNVQMTAGGTYSVVVSNLAGVVTSSNAVLTVGYAPSFTVEPVAQSAVAGNTVTFDAAVSGTGPFAYQWSLDGTTIANATNSSLTLTSVPTNAAGAYQVTVSDAFGSITSSNAALVVEISQAQVGNVTAGGGLTVTIPVQLISVGTEGAIGFSLDFDPAVLTYVGAVAGTNAAGTLFLLNTNQTGSGRLGVAIAQTSGAFPAGTNDVADVTFKTAVLTNTTTTPINFGSQPTAEGISDYQSHPLQAQFTPGVVSIVQAILEGDVWPLPGGDDVVTVSDWVQEGRFVTGLDAITNAGQLQRADCAPRDTSGDGELTVADWVQVGRYAAGLDALTAVPGGAPHGLAKSPVKNDTARPLSVMPLTQGGLTNSVLVDLVAQGGENSLGFSLAFNPTLVRFVNATLASGAGGAVLFQNTNQAAKGYVGFLVGFNLQGSPDSFGAGTQQVLRLNFTSASYSNNAVLNFCDTPVSRGLASVSALTLPLTTGSGMVAMAGLSWPLLNVGQTNGQVTLSWPLAAAAFRLEASSALNGTWAPVGVGPVTNGARCVFTATNGGAQTFYRLHLD